MKRVVAEQIRDAGYEVLFLLGGDSGHPVMRPGREADRVNDWLGGTAAQRQGLRRLGKRGLIEAGVSGDGLGVRITARGAVAFAGGRNPEEWWGRGWDGKWRMLSFDLPRTGNATRMKWRRWLCAERFGRLQGSVWVSPDPVPAMDGVLEHDGIEASMVMVFEGNLAGADTRREVAVLGWDFEEINTGYMEYVALAGRMVRELSKMEVDWSGVRELLAVERKGWFAAVRRDPLLPRELLPVGYEGTVAWRERMQLMGILRQELGLP